MTEARVGRLLAASLHQAITELLSDRLEFYESWLGPKGWRGSNLGLAPMLAVMSFLRREGDAYDQVMARAGVLAADWTFAAQSRLQKRVTPWLPRPLRVRAALRLASRTMRDLSPATRIRLAVNGRTARVDVKNSVFCAVREPQAAPLCQCYSAIAVETLRQMGLASAGRIMCCRAMGQDVCSIVVEVAA
jgi:hypothetical protein